ncbi:MAG: transglutaminase-like domain-containing protein [bacterium]
MNNQEACVCFRILSCLLCLITIWAYGIFIFFTIFEIEFITKAFYYSLILILGYIWSWYHRNSPQYFVKFILALSMIIAAVNFFKELAGSIYDPRIPLIELLIVLLLIHSFDLPKKKDILYSIASSMVILMVLSAISISSFLPLFMFIFFFILFVTLFSMDLDDNIRGWIRILSRISFGLVSFVFILGFILFIILPKPTGGYFLRYVFTPRQELSNYIPTTKYEQNKQSIENIFSKNHTYRSFKGQMDLTDRGLLPHIVVMKVKAPTVTYIKGIHLAQYDGKKWYNGDQSEIIISSGSYSYFSLPSEFDYYTSKVVNTYYVVLQDLPDILYHIPVPFEAFFPSNYLRIKNQNFYTEYPLVKGLTYTISTKIIYFDFEKIKDLSMKDYQIFLERIMFRNINYKVYLELPDGLSIRIKQLAESISSEYDNFWDKVEGIKYYLEKNYTYDLFIEEPKEEPVYEFLFVKYRGYCEQFSSALAIMLRSIGIPCRIALGYLPKEKDIFTGYMNVYADDAHAWVEVLTPLGWVPVDPSPSNVDQKTIQYLYQRSVLSSVSPLEGIEPELVENLSYLLKLVITTLFISIISFLVFMSYLNIRKKYIKNYLLTVNFANLNPKDFSKTYSLFMEYFKYSDLLFPTHLTLREMVIKDIQDPVFQRFKTFVNLYERFIYGRID